MLDCKRVEEWMPLYVEGDLNDPQASQLRAHAQTCGACGQLVADYEASQAWLRAEATPMFDDAFVDAVRAGVMREINAVGTRRPFVERLRDWVAPRPVVLAAAALVLIFIALALFIYLSRPRANHQNDEKANVAPVPLHKPMIEPNDKQTARSPQEAAPATPSSKRPMPHRVAHTLARRAPRYSRRVEAAPDSALAQAQTVAPIDSSNAAATSEERLRIEIQTADPNIRIIWFAPKSKETDAP